MPPGRRPSLVLITVAGWWIVLSGCAKFDLQESLTLFKEDTEPQVPERMVCVWAQTVLHKAGKPSIRGFGGRIWFYGAEDEEPVRVDGRLTVYAFDDENPKAKDPTPEKKFAFPRDTFDRHQSESSLGPSYSFWLPWNEVGGPQRQISLIGRFEDASGKIVMSRPARVALPGKSGEAEERPAARQEEGSAKFPVQPAGYSEDADASLPEAEEKPRPSMQTTTIPVTPSFANRLLAVDEASAEKPPSDSTTGRTVNRRADPAGSEEAAEELTDRAAEERSRYHSDRSKRPSTRSAPGRFPARNRPTGPPSFDPVRRGPFRGEWLHGLPPTPRRGRNPTTPGSAADEPPP
jgi:hypothetical protein